VLGRLLSLVLGLAVVALVAYWAINNIAGAEKQDPLGRSQPKEVLDRVRETTKQIEQDAEKRARDTERRMDEAR
jgi:hypothetical protein